MALAPKRLRHLRRWAVAALLIQGPVGAILGTFPMFAFYLIPLITRLIPVEALDAVLRIYLEYRLYVITLLAPLSGGVCSLVALVAMLKVREWHFLLFGRGVADFAWTALKVMVIC